VTPKKPANTKAARNSVHPDDAALAAKLGVTPERIVAELVKIAHPHSEIAHLIGEEDRAAALATLARIKPQFLAACGIRIKRVAATE
jgi:hypothetical protein